MSKLDGAPKRNAASASHEYPKKIAVRRRPRLTVRTVVGGNERDFDHGSALRGTRTRTGAVGLPKRATTAVRNFAASFDNQPQ